MPEIFLASNILRVRGGTVVSGYGECGIGMGHKWGQGWGWSGDRGKGRDR
jgi:hypothetical protein